MSLKESITEGIMAEMQGGKRTLEKAVHIGAVEHRRQRSPPSCGQNVDQGQDKTTGLRARMHLQRPVPQRAGQFIIHVESLAASNSARQFTFVT